MRGWVEVQQEGGDGGFAAAGWSYDGGAGSARDGERNTVEDLGSRAGRVGEGDICEGDGARGGEFEGALVLVRGFWKTREAEEPRCGLARDVDLCHVLGHLADIVDGEHQD